MMERRYDPLTFDLSFPGLPTCAGMNSEGLTLLWTGSGYLPPRMPKVGIPTYGLVFELLLKKDVPAAVKYLKGIKNAGAFIFFLADKKGNFVVVEAVPGRIFVYEAQEAVRAIYIRALRVQSSHNKSFQRKSVIVQRDLRF